MIICSKFPGPAGPKIIETSRGLVYILPTTGEFYQVF